MTQNERRIFLIEYLLKEGNYTTKIPENADEQRYLLRSLLNVRQAIPASEEFLRVQDEYLREANESRGIISLSDLNPVGGVSTHKHRNDIYLWRGDITTLRVGAIVNAANSGLTGCWQPCHACIDNCIHTFAGIQLRKACANLMQKQGHEEPTGKAKITPAFNLPCDFVIHTVGPIVSGRLTQEHCHLLASCYTSCLTIAEENGIKSIAFCCISTGIFCFPAEKAAEIAVSTVENWKTEYESDIKVIFNVFSEKDERIYKKVLEII